MPSSAQVWSLVSGVLVANSAPHLATAVAGRTHLTPLAGRDSSPAVNALWGGINLAGGLALVRYAAGASPVSARRDERLHWFGLGVAAFSVWMVASEYWLGVNSPGRTARTGR